MTQQEFREGMKLLTAIRKSLQAGADFRKKIAAKYPTEVMACEGLSVLQIASVQQMGEEIEELWRAQG